MALHKLLKKRARKTSVVQADSKVRFHTITSSISLVTNYQYHELRNKLANQKTRYKYLRDSNTVLCAGSQTHYTQGSVSLRRRQFVVCRWRGKKSHCPRYTTRWKYKNCLIIHHHNTLKKKTKTKTTGFTLFELLSSFRYQNLRMLPAHTLASWDQINLLRFLSETTGLLIKLTLLAKTQFAPSWKSDVKSCFLCTHLGWCLYSKSTIRTNVFHRLFWRRPDSETNMKDCWDIQRCSQRCRTP